MCCHRPWEPGGRWNPSESDKNRRNSSKLVETRRNPSKGNWAAVFRRCWKRVGSSKSVKIRRSHLGAETLTKTEVLDSPSESVGISVGIRRNPSESVEIRRNPLEAVEIH